MTPSAFLFDIGNVIIAFDFRIAAARLEPHSLVKAPEALVLVSELTHELELGQLSPDEFIEKASRKIGYSGSPEFFRKSFEDVFELNARIVELIETLDASGMPLFLLSNTNGIHVPFFEKTYAVFSRFAGRIYSHEVGMMKPDPAIFEIAIRNLSLSPESTVYIDDLPANCEAGRAAGLIAVQYTPENPDGFFAELAPFLPQ